MTEASVTRRRSPARRSRRAAAGGRFRLARLGLAVALLLPGVPVRAQPPPAAGGLPAKTVRQIAALLAAKAERESELRKASSELPDAPRADAPAAAVEGVASRAAPFPLTSLAALEAVRSSRPADEPITYTRRSARRAGASAGRSGAAVTRKQDTSRGDAAHQADLARLTHGVDGTGIGVGVLSDGVDSLAFQQAAGDLPLRVSVLPGQAGSGDEGTAMLEIVHDLAPGAELYFATGTDGQAQLAANIEALCEAGADVIVDDIFYVREPAFQDGAVARGVNAAVEAGCVYFSMAGNGGNLNDGTSGVWEGDYVAGAAFEAFGEQVGAAHDFGAGVEQNRVEKDSPYSFVLQWADPWGASANDYDLFLVAGNGDVVRSSTDTQDGTQDPIEVIGSSGRNDAGKRLVVVRTAGAAGRYLRLSAVVGELAAATRGQTFGHNAAAAAIGVAGVHVGSAGGTGGVFDGSESVATYSSDGPRRIFFEPDGTPLTPGDFSSTGGQLLQKPDLAAATCVSAASLDPITFCGTSAAAPHAAAIAALLLEAAGGPANLAPAAVRAALTGAALDIEATGVDPDAGAGLVMAPAAVAAVAVAAADRNRAPEVQAEPGAQTLVQGGAEATIELAGAFVDPDDDALSYAAWSTDPVRVQAALQGTSLTLTPGAAGLADVVLRVADPDGLAAVRIVQVRVTAGSRDYDVDDDRLVEIRDLAQLDAVRYDLNGDGATDRAADARSYFAAFPDAAERMGCPRACAGYELQADLDFDTDTSGDAGAGDDYWDGGAGWRPIGRYPQDVTSQRPFTGDFEGNGHVVANLFIDRPDRDGVGLFGFSLGTLRGLGLANVDVTGGDAAGGLAGAVVGKVVDCYATGSVWGGDYVGGLVGHAGASRASEVRRAWAAVRVTAAGDHAGGLIGWVSPRAADIVDTYATGRVTAAGDHAGGLVGWSGAVIAASFATGSVAGRRGVGGLVGTAGEDIWGSYATGRVTATGSGPGGAVACGEARGAGGLAGSVCGEQTRLGNSYATGPVSGDVTVGGLAGAVASDSRVYRSYWDLDTSGMGLGVGSDDRDGNGAVDGAETRTLGVGGRTTATLQAGAVGDDLYRSWSRTRWDFGSSAEYPALAADLDRDQQATWQEFGYQVRAGPALTATPGTGTAVALAWTAVDTSHWSPPPPVAYALTRDDGASVELLASDLDALGHVDTGAAAGAVYAYQVTAAVAGGHAVRSARVRIAAGRAGGLPVAAGTLEDLTLRVGTPVTVDVTGAFGDPDGDALTYSAASSAGSVATVSVSGGQVTVTPAAAGRAVVTVTATDPGPPPGAAPQRFAVTVWEADVVDYYDDDDGLIDVASLVQLDAMRHDLNADGVAGDGIVSGGVGKHAAAFPGAAPGMGCGDVDGCRGYELRADLDFDTNGDGGPDAGDDWWNGGRGWDPIRGTILEAVGLICYCGGYRGTFEGNGHVIANLFVDRAGAKAAGLFGIAHDGSVIRRVGLTGVDVTGGRTTGGLVGFGSGAISGSFVTGAVSGGNATGGLIGVSRGDVTASYAAVRVSGDDEDAGGLVGRNSWDAVVTASFATGRVSGAANVGGLVGMNRETVIASYATGHVSGAAGVGGLVGRGVGSVDRGYWDTGTSGQTGGGKGAGLSTSALQALGAGDLSADHPAGDPWRTGTSAEYPALAVDFDGNGEATWQEFGHQLRSGPVLTAAAGSTQVALTWTPVDAGHWTPPPAVTYTLTRRARAAGAPVETLVAGTGGLEHVDAGVTDGDAYDYQVAAAAGGGEAARSALVAVTVGAPSPRPPPPPPPPPPECVFAAAPAHRDVLWTAGTGQVAVTTGAGCAWTAASESAFLTLTAGASGAGPGTVEYAVAANAGGPRTGSLVAAGQRVTVYQASPAAFTDHPLEPGVTPVRAIHFLELRARIDARRAGVGLPAFDWSDPALVPGVTPVRSVHLTELRAALAEAYAAEGGTPPAWTDAAPGSAAGIRAVHLTELRAAVAAPGRGGGR